MTPTPSGLTSIHSTADVVNRGILQGFPDFQSLLPASSPLPFYLHCLGGSWEGHLVGWEGDWGHVRLTGFPPIEISQHIQVQWVDQDHEHPLQQVQYVIRDIRVKSGSTAWIGTTDILLEIRAWNGGYGHLPTGKTPFTPGRAGSILLGQTVDDSPGIVGNIETLGADCPPFTPSSPQRRNESRSWTLSPRKGSIHSNRLTIEKGNGQQIQAYHDRPGNEDSTELPVVVIAPGYGETKRDYLTLAYYFATNGFRVVRYDHTNHVGESDGPHYHASLSSMKDDFQTVTRFIRDAWPHSTIIGVASSLASRVALKAEAENQAVSLLIMLMGIVNVQRSAATVHQEDIFAGYADGRYPEATNILGFNVGSQFLGDAITNKFVTLEHTLHDAESGNTPMIVVAAGKDAWVAPDDLQAFRKALGHRVEHWIEVPEALHRLQENPKIARETYRQVVAQCRKRATMNPMHDVIQHPNRLDLGRQNREEKMALQQQGMTEVGPGFWQDYLGHFQSVGKCLDYVKLLDHVFHALEPVAPGQRVLDAGCGNGNAGLFLLNRLQPCLPGVVQFREKSIQYVGIDVVPEALERANRTMTAAVSEIEHGDSSVPPLMTMSWAQVDLSQSLPFPDNTFDRIVSNLVLGYVRDPGAALKELYRVLAPGGRLVISNLKPNGDFSGIYQNLVSSAALPQQREEARDLLNNYGKIRQAEKEGQFYFFDRAQWESIINTLDSTNAEVYPTFAGQAYLIVMDKPAAWVQTAPTFIQGQEQQSGRVPGSGMFRQVA
jgi:ubiquinone/menaquinone biosynthesis C-methylase UbiE/alpha-beta hydrolase superfamily lysophospholipase